MSTKKSVKVMVSKKERDFYDKILSELEQKELNGQLVGSDSLAENATAIDKMKWDICREVLIFKKTMNFTSTKMSELMNVDKSRTSEILHYKIDKFTLDRLMGCLLLLKGMNSVLDKKIDLLFSALNRNQFAS